MPDLMNQNVVESVAKAARARAREMTASEARNAIAIDFEGRGVDRRAKADPPHPDFLGYQVGRDGDARGWLLNPRLAFLAKSTRGRSKHVEPEGLEEGILTLIDLAEAEDRLILHFSRYEVVTLHRFLSTDAFEACVPFLADGKALMEKALTKPGEGRPAKGSRTLTEMGKKLCPGVTRTQEDLDVGVTLKNLAASADRSQRVRRVPTKRMERWLDLLEYNALDLKILIRGCEKSVKRLTNKGH